MGKSSRYNLVMSGDSRTEIAAPTSRVQLPHYGSVLKVSMRSSRVHVLPSRDLQALQRHKRRLLIEESESLTVSVTCWRYRLRRSRRRLWPRKIRRYMIFRASYHGTAYIHYYCHQYSVSCQIRSSTSEILRQHQRGDEAIRTYRLPTYISCLSVSGTVS